MNSTYLRVLLHKGYSDRDFPGQVENIQTIYSDLQSMDYLDEDLNFKSNVMELRQHFSRVLENHDLPCLNLSEIEVLAHVNDTGSEFHASTSSHRAALEGLIRKGALSEYGDEITDLGRNIIGKIESVDFSPLIETAAHPSMH